MLMTIFTHTPLWVWGLLTALLLLGLWQRRTRRVAPRSLLALPIALLVLGLSSSVAGFMAQPVSALAWAALLAAGVALGRRLPPPSGTVWLAAEQRLHLPGSWWPMVIIVTIFSMRYVSAVALAMTPAWRGDATVLSGLAAVYGLLGGVFLGRALGLRRMAGGEPGHEAGSLTTSASLQRMA